MNAFAHRFDSETAYSGEIIPFPSNSPVPASPGTALVDRKAFARAVEIATHVVERRSAAVLANLKLTGNGSCLFVTGTDCDIEISVSIAAAADAHFGVTVPAHTLKDLVKKAPDCEFIGFTAAEVETKNRMKRTWNDQSRKFDEIETGETYEECTTPAVIDFEKVNYRLKAEPVSDFPTMDDMRPSHSFSLRGSVLLDAMNAVSIAVSTEETRYYLNGIYFHALNDALCMVATDGHRLCKQEFPLADGCQEMPGVIIPRKAVALLQKLWKGKNCPDAVKVEVSDTHIRLTFDVVTVTMQVVDGTFPDYSRVIPLHNEHKSTFSAAEMVEAIRAVTVISDVRNRVVKLTFDKGNCRLDVNEPDTGSSSSDIACDFDGDRVVIGFNAAQAISLIEAAGSKAITIAMQDSGAPALIAGERDGWIGVLMPMRV